MVTGKNGREKSVGVEKVRKGALDKFSPFSSVLRARQESWDGSKARLGLAK